MKTRPCDMQRIFSALKNENFTEKKMIFSLLLLKTLNVGTCLTCTHNLCFGSKISSIALYTPVLLYKIGV